MIQQLRAATIACSFLHVGSSYHPRSANGLVPYPDLLRFLATATLGSYMTVFPAPVINYFASNHKTLINEFLITVICDFVDSHGRNGLEYVP